MPPNQAAEATPPENNVDGGDPTAEEARLAAELETLGDDKEAEQPAGDAPGADDAGKEGEGAAKDDAGDDAPPTEEPAAPAPAAARPASPPAPPPPEAPAPPRDFDVATKEIKAKYDAGDLDDDEYLAEQRKIGREEAGFIARQVIFEDRQQAAVEHAQRDFSDAARAWEADNKDFMGNVLRAQAMQSAIAAIDQRTPGLPPAELLKQAASEAFDAFGYKPPAAAGDPADAKKAIAAAAAARKPGAVPPTLGGAPTAGAVDAQPGNTAFAALDALGIDDLENRLAHMSAADQERYLRDAPGAGAHKE